MEIVCVDARKIVNLKSKLESLKAQAQQLQVCKRDKSTIDWIDGQEVMAILNISPRTLQTYRDNGMLPFSQIGAKFYYKPSDVELILKTSKIK